MIKSLCFFVLCLGVLQIVTSAATDNKDHSGFRNCLEKVIELTQSCSNDNLAFTTILGRGSGFGSEFMAYYANTLFTGMLQNRRVIIVRTRRAWEYDCESESNWGCFFTLNACPNSLVDPAGIDIHKWIEYHNYPKDSGSDFILQSNLRLAQQSQANDFMEKFQNVIKEAYAAKYPALKDVCSDSMTHYNHSVQNFKTSLLAGVIVKYLYQLNDDMLLYVQDATLPYYQLLQQHNVPTYPRLATSSSSTEKSSKNGIPVLPRHHYAAIQLRLTDKKYETPEESWKLISNMQYVAKTVLLMLRDYAIYNPKEPVLDHIFIATDNCTAAGELVTHIHSFVQQSKQQPAILPTFNDSDKHTNYPAFPDTYFYLGTCFNSQGQISAEKKNYNPRQQDRVYVDPSPRHLKILKHLQSSSSSTNNKHTNNNNNNDNNNNNSNNSKNKNIHMLSDQRRPRANAVQLVADIDMLAQSTVFLGSFFSNMVRLVHYLRVAASLSGNGDERYKWSYHMVIDDPTFQDRENMRDHM